MSGSLKIYEEGFEMPTGHNTTLCDQGNVKLGMSWEMVCMKLSANS